MREAYFSVGEEVILVSEAHPECNGSSVIASMEYREFFCRYVNKHIATWAYKLDSVEHTWQESCLRKKHKPSEFTFEQLIKQEVPVDG